METSQPDAARGTLATYVTGFVSSLVLTIGAYLVVAQHALRGNGLIAVIIVLAIVQLTVQLVFFLHLGRESKPRWNLVAFLFMLLVLIIVVFASLWIMHNLNYHMTPHQIDQYMTNQSGL